MLEVCVWYFSYKEHDSSQETDSDEIVEGNAEMWNEPEDDGTEAIEKIMDYRVSSLKQILNSFFQG